MEATQKEKNIKVIKDVLKQYLQDKSYRNTPERYAILEEIYNMDHHFNVDDLYLIMINKKYHVSKATIYNTIEIFLDAGLIRKHQFGEKTMSSSSYEKSYFDKQHDHLVIYKDGSDKEIEEIIEFCDLEFKALNNLLKKHLA
jgi:Fur family ferric uptake transcriptional regulator